MQKGEQKLNNGDLGDAGFLIPVSTYVFERLGKKIG